MLMPRMRLEMLLSFKFLFIIVLFESFVISIWGLEAPLQSTNHNSTIPLPAGVNWVAKELPGTWILKKLSLYPKGSSQETQMESSLAGKAMLILDSTGEPSSLAHDSYLHLYGNLTTYKSEEFYFLYDLEIDDWKVIAVPLPSGDSVPSTTGVVSAEMRLLEKNLNRIFRHSTFIHIIDGVLELSGKSGNVEFVRQDKQHQYHPQSSISPAQNETNRKPRTLRQEKQPLLNGISGNKFRRMAEELHIGLTFKPQNTTILHDVIVKLTSQRFVAGSTKIRTTIDFIFQTKEKGAKEEQQTYKAELQLTDVDSEQLTFEVLQVKPLKTYQSSDDNRKKEIELIMTNLKKIIVASMGTADGPTVKLLSPIDTKETIVTNFLRTID